MQNFLSSFRDCCSNFIETLPNAEVSFIPALIAGSLFSLLILTWMYKKHHKKSLRHAFVQMFNDIFVTIPSSEHSEFMKCDNENCVRCQKSEKLKQSIVTQWRELEVNGETTKYHSRIADSVRKLSLPNGVSFTKSSKKQPSSQKPTLFMMDLPANPIWTDLDAFQMDKELLKINFKSIKFEYEEIFKVFQSGKTDGWKLNHIPSGHWCIFPLIDQGVMNLENGFKCPLTTNLIKNLPSMMKDCVFGNACFSLLYQDSFIEPHCGPTNLRLRCHLGIDVPDEDCWLEVDGEQFRWKERECIMFDDSFEHSAFFEPNKSYVKPRVVLIIDFWHPQISVKEKQILSKLLHP